ncbi:MAG TPA: oligosaccharide flippase family protein [Patescibacteria group bacterium]|nr:oligosaccharide flippase family protein [Patescibacteria group bacterium]
MTVERVGRAMSWNLAAKAARFMAAPISYIVIVRSLGEHNWGLLNVLRTITGFAFVLVMMGGGNALLKYLPEIRVRGGIECFMGTVRRLALIQGAVWIALLVIVRFGGTAFGSFFGEHSPRFSLYAQIAAAFVAFEVLLTLSMNALQSWYETRVMGIVIIIGNICYLIFVMLFLKIGWGIIGVLLAGAVTNAGMFAALAPQVRGCAGDEQRRPAVASPDLGMVLRFSLPFVATGILNQIVWRHSEVIFLGHYTGVEAAGYFGLAYRTPQMLLEFIPLAIWPIVMAGTSEAYARNAASLSRAIDLYYRLLFILVMPVAALGFAFSRPLVPILFGDAMMPAAALTQLFFVVFSYSFLYTPLSMALYVMERSWVNMLVFAFLAIVNVGLDLAFIPRFGLWGAFFPVAFVLVLGVIVFYAVLRRIRPDITVPFRFILRCYVAAIPAGLLVFAAARWDSIAAMVVQIPIGIVLLVLGFRWMRVIGEDERRLIMRLPIPFKERIIRVF